MSMFDNIRDKAEDAAREHPDQVDEGIDKAGDFADDRTGGRYSDQVDQGQEKAGDYVDGLGGDDDTDDEQ
ncbi:MAG: antitoxin [Streptosporangiales bacterium]|nr:antitoxin [Streptosporangiales bacterium]MBO0889502.1 antitoxin [Acidothermales bacterium]